MFKKAIYCIKVQSQKYTTHTMSMKGTDVKEYKLRLQGVGNHQILNVIVICPYEDDLISHVAW